MSSKLEQLKYFDITYKWTDDGKNLVSVKYQHRFSSYYIEQLAHADISFEENLKKADEAFWEWFFDQASCLMEGHQ